MNLEKISFNTLGGVFLGGISYALGGLDSAIITLLIVMAIDYLTGVCKALYNKKVNSMVGIKGIIKKVGYLLIVALSVKLDQIAGQTGAIRTLVIYFFVANEGISILENWGNMGLPLPKKLMGTLEQLKKESDK
ncbi:MAG: phage holin family protein [Bacilli bacterium]|nr:phage holin family protein [Bacilli bacterium]